MANDADGTSGARPGIRRRARRILAARILPLGSELCATETRAGPRGWFVWLVRPLLARARDVSWRLLEDPTFLARVVEAVQARTYLELGIAKALNFNIISREVPYCVGVDIDPKCREWIGEDTPRNRFFPMSTDAYFAKYVNALPNGQKADVIYIDASHEYRQTLRDFEHSLTVVSDNGVIVLHDTRPPAKECLHTALCGSVWKAIFHIRIQSPELQVYTSVANVFGQSVIMPGPQPCPVQPIIAEESELTNDFEWEFFQRHHRDVLGVQPDDFIIRQIREYASSPSAGSRGRGRLAIHQ